MPNLLFEIWEDPDSHSFEMSQVTERGDELRTQVAPRSILRHSFHAGSDFEAHQLNYDWHGWGRWRPQPDWQEQSFTAEDAAVQVRYLALRGGS
jgi:hypothetical protein